MKKLYKIKVLHGGPKDSHESIETYLVAENDLEVFDWIDGKNYKCWSEHEKYLEEGEESGYYDETEDKPISMKEWVIANKGDLSDENGWGDAYYGVTKWGWEEVIGEITAMDLETLVYLKIAQHA
jgi:hypothetical protein